MLHKTLFANYDSACIIVNLSQVYVKLNSKFFFYEFKLTQFHVYKAYNLSLFYVLFEYNLRINAVNCNSLRCIKLLSKRDVYLKYDSNVNSQNSIKFEI